MATTSAILSPAATMLLCFMRALTAVIPAPAALARVMGNRGRNSRQKTPVKK